MQNTTTRAPRTFAAPRRSGEDGQGLAEYSLILAFIALVCVGALITLGGSISTHLNSVAGLF